jgi:hypothetical protein
MKRLLWTLVPALLLAGCGERDQVKTAANTNRGDTPAWQGPKSVYTAQGWAPGDSAAWAAQMRTRALGQNEYVKVN